MSRRLAFLIAGALACTCPATAQTPPPDGVNVLLARLEMLMQGGDAAGGLSSLLVPTFPSDDLENFKEYLLKPDTRRAVVAERDRTPLVGALPGDGYRLMAELYTESSERARIVTVLLAPEPEVVEEMSALVPDTTRFRPWKVVEVDVPAPTLSPMELAPVATSVRLRASRVPDPPVKLSRRAVPPP